MPFVTVARADEIPAGRGACLEHAGFAVAVFNAEVP